VEDTKVPSEPGAGLCPGFTTSFTILSDAVALSRGDRFNTVDYTPATLTNFGSVFTLPRQSLRLNTDLAYSFSETQSDPNIAGGGLMHKLLTRAFPGWFDATNIYTLYPFNTPQSTEEMLKRRASKVT